MSRNRGVVTLVQDIPVKRTQVFAPQCIISCVGLVNGLPGDSVSASAEGSAVGSMAAGAAASTILVSAQLIHTSDAASRRVGLGHRECREAQNRRDYIHRFFHGIYKTS